MLGFSLGSAALPAVPLRPAAAPAVPPTPIAYTLLYDFESIGTATGQGATLAQHTGSRKVLGAAGLQIVSNGTLSGPNALNVTATTADLAGFTRIAFCVDAAAAAYCPINQVKPRFVAGGNTYNTTFDPATGISGFNDAGPETRGKVWCSFYLPDVKVGSYAGAAITAAGTASKQLTIATNLDTTSAYAVDQVVDAAVLLPAGYKPTICITFDDGNDSQYTNAYPALAARGLVASLYIPYGLINTTTRLTTAMVATLKAEGWAVCLDSDPTDLPLTAYDTVANAVAALDAMKANVLNAWGDAEGAKHLCYSYHQLGCYGKAPVSFFATPNGTTALNTASTAPYAYCCKGARIFEANSNTLVGIVASVSGQYQLTLDRAVTGAARNFYVSGGTAGQAATCNGTTTITGLGNTNYMFAGLHVLGYNVPADTRIVSVDSATQITVDKAVPASCPRIRTAFLDSPWWPDKVADALIAAGYKTGRHSRWPGSTFTGFGLDPRTAIQYPSLGFDYASAAATDTLVATIKAHVLAGRDLILFAHSPQPSEMAGHYNVVFDAIKTLVDAGACDVKSIPAWWDTVSARAAIG